jgi:hypothetical protein
VLLWEHVLVQSDSQSDNQSQANQSVDQLLVFLLVSVLLVLYSWGFYLWVVELLRVRMLGYELVYVKVRQLGFELGNELGSELGSELDFWLLGLWWWDMRLVLCRRQCLLVEELARRWWERR